MHPNLKETFMALLGAAIMILAMPYIILAGSAEYAILIYIYKQVMQ